jgi:hypothetical protein
MGLFSFSRSPISIPARRIYQSRDDSKLKIDVDIKYCVHGYLAKDKKQPASLIIFAPQLDCVNRETINIFTMEVNFYDQDGSSQPCNPTVISTAPFSVQECVDGVIVDSREKVAVLVKRNKKVNGTAGVNIGLNAGLGGELAHETQHNRELEHFYQKRYFIKGSSNTRVDDSGRRYGVSWNVKKSNNPDAGDDAGIPSNYLFVVLLTRTNNSTPFEARFRLSARVGMANKRERVIEVVTRPFTKSKTGRPSSVNRLSQELKNFTARDCDGTAKPTVFDPRTKHEGDYQDIDRLQIGRYKKVVELEKLAIVPRP